MSTISICGNATLASPTYESPHVAELVNDIIAEVAEVIAPVWPLKDYVAVNPYSGVSHRSFMDARAFLRVFSECEMLMPIEHYAAEFHRGQFSLADIESAVIELSSVGISQALSVPQVAAKLAAIGPLGTKPAQHAATANHDRSIRTIAEYANSPPGVDWTETIVAEISKYCSAHYDREQATWSSPYQALSLYQAWRSAAEHDCNIELLGLSRFRKYVASLPYTPEAAIVYSLQRLQVPQPLWTTFLLCQAFSIPGWCAWTKYKSAWVDSVCVENNDLTGLLAIRLAYDAGLAKAQSLTMDWSPHMESQSVLMRPPRTAPDDDSMLRFTLLRASEIGFRKTVLAALTAEQPEASSDRKLAQMVFCIDVRSERIRRHLELQASDIETFGFAGFFGMAFDFVKLGQTSGNSHLPVLLKPQFQLYEGIHEGDTPHENLAISQRRLTRSWRTLWKGFQSSAVGCFSFVETAGLFYGFKLLARTIGYKAGDIDTQFDGVAKQDRDKLGPTLRGLNHQGITTSRQTDMAEGMLRNLGLTKDFAQLVVFCGHSSQTENNPLAAGLDCGACGGHSGAPNARFAALLLNQPYIRQALAERGIAIPDDTYFLGALHNTTTDSIEFFDVDEIPLAQQAALQELRSSCQAATTKTLTERVPTLAGNSLSDLLKRASDWSEVRPEWGLAGNAAFIVAPRSITRNANLDGRAFLHSYDTTRDKDGSVLETIMTAPMVVANWINMQYYASTVDNQHFGSGNKTVHNVVGKFGILSGNGGDLMTGLPWQSLHTGDAYQHLPMRLQVVIAAPREMIDRVIVKHAMVANLLNGAWLHLVAIENGQTYRYSQAGAWEEIQMIGT
ncbi:MAG: DUF2309 domain-containing protein [Planctomycetales bacterium]|nr:DUF2309 domain-containing protein [Planctomycetales bacterium]